MIVKNPYISVQLEATGHRIDELRRQKGYSVKDIQSAMGFEQPQAIYKWLHGQSLPNYENLLTLAWLFGVRVDDILVYDGDFSLSGFRGGKIPFFHSNRVEKTMDIFFQNLYTFLA